MKFIKMSLIVTTVILLQGCINGTSPESRYYRMNSLMDADQKPAKQLQQYSFRLGVGPITLADYLDRPQMIERSSSNQLQTSEFDRWSGSLQDNIEIALIENMQALLGSDKVVGYPWPRAVKPDYHAFLKVLRFDASGNKVVLRASWIILGENDKELLNLQTMEINELATTADYEALVAAKSLALQKLAGQLVAALKEIIETDG